jgi:GT2 family glycosyltransferase
MTIGLALITFKRQAYLEQALRRLEENSWGGAEIRLVVVDEPHTFEYGVIQQQYPDVSFMYHSRNMGVATAKNTALKELSARGTEDFFLMEDDILMKHPFTCNLYCEYARRVGVEHLNFALHGTMNKGHKRMMVWRTQRVCVYPDCVGAFSYYSKKCIDTVGLLDENFKNAWEHVELTKRIIDAGMHPPFWYFIDHEDSDTMLEEIPGSIDNSSIRPRADWGANIEQGHKHWMSKHGEWLPKRPLWRDNP